MNKQTEKLIEQAKQDVLAILQNKIIEALKNETSNTNIVFDLENLCIRSFNFEIDFKNKDHLKYLTSIKLNRITLMRYDEDNGKLFSCLTKDEQKSYLSRQNYYFSKDSFLDFSIDKEMFTYCRNMFKKSFEKYVELIAKELSNEYIEKEYTRNIEPQIKKYVELKFCEDDALNRVREEFAQLKEKTMKLGQFLKSDKFKSLNKTQRELLPLQLENMNNYLYILHERIIHWLDKDEETVECSDNRCCSCGSVIPEGRLVCVICGG